MKFIMKERGFETEVPFGKLQVCGDDSFGYRPYQLLVSSVAVCSAGVLRSILNKKRLNYSNITVQTDMERNEKQANKIEKIHMHFTIQGKELTEEKIEKALHLTRKNCSMVQSVKDSILITESFEIENE